MVYKVYRTEGYVGQAIRESGLSRNELFVTTKWSGFAPLADSIQNSLDQVRVRIYPRVR